VHIDVIHDTACPWCRVGKANLKAALAEWTGEPVTVKYWAYLLNPNLPPEGSSFAEIMSSKYKGVSLAQMFDGPRRAGQAAGLIFNFEAITRAPNTILSHRMIAIAPPDKQEPLMDAIYAAYFEHGQDISDRDVLLDLAAQVGIDREAIAAQIDAGAGLEQVVEEVQAAYNAQLSGVPFFIFDSKLALSGAQPAHVFTEVLERAAAEVE
jgi:predicted DsbA family dithiol-disulfide isomerase